MRIEAAPSDSRVTPLELFFDLVFVFALTQVTAFMAGDLTGRGVVRGVLVLGLLWWSWTGALQGEHALAKELEVTRPRLARDASSFLHFPLLTGVVLLALGLKKVLEYVGDTEEHQLRDPLTGIGLYALFGGVVIYLLGHVPSSGASPTFSRSIA